MLVCLIASWDSSSQRNKTDSAKLWNGFIYKGGRTGVDSVKKREQITRLSQVAGTGFCIEFNLVDSCQCFRLGGGKGFHKNR